MANVHELARGFSYLECPRWRDGRLYVSDFYTHQVLAVDESGSVETIAKVPEQPSGLGWLPDGRLLVVSMRDRRVLRQESDGTLTEHADLSELTTWHLNDMLVDDAGRAYVGSFGFDLMSGAPMQTSNIVLVNPDGSAQVAAEGLAFPNGMTFVDGGSTLVVSESFGNRLGGFSVSATGELSEPRAWASFGPAPTSSDITEVLGAVSVLPDGICTADDNTVWVADAVGHRVIRVAEGGSIVDQVTTGDLSVFACALGGSDGRTLFMCAAPSFAEHERRDTRESVLLTAKV
ncbi:SMP-30/gluconolactonase/LRE family protein [Rhodococcus opacus]|uniref:SMP-30/gluconolactonase/LRE family protein n=1 Tax=Rhodococcus opacus TaxID=37919 RepID=UPI00247325CA|nr:SMP-30/gluconolactonase/LRE family protein [Rhodococcus opacus]MDH6291994.1 sugar lactone lactonase YvrE [Rhodococcus opacus]